MIEIEDNDESAQLEARGFRFAGMVFYHPARGSIGFVWAVPQQEQDEIIREIGGDPEKFKPLRKQ